ncbi:MAG: alanine racemase [Ruminococcus sp.]|nr:alanine racemase [Ruminococcus sp.]
MKNVLHRAWTEINLSALAHNIEAVRAVLPHDTELMAVVKANAYGHGDEAVCKKLSDIGVSWFAVSNLEEALTVRNVCPDAEIFILGYTPPECAPDIAANNIIQGVMSIDYAKELCKFANTPVRCHIKLDTGMGRIGFRSKDTDACVNELLPVFDMKMLLAQGIYTHFAAADSPDKHDIEYTEMQEKRIFDIYDRLAELGHRLKHIHCMNSAASIVRPNKRCTLARIGIVMYGLLPNYPVKLPIELKPVMTFKSVISQVKEIEESDCVSYGRTFAAPSIRKVATITVGYADGYARLLSNKGKVLVHGTACPIIGRVCMDQLMLDITDVSETVKSGDEVTLFGDCEITADWLASLYGTIGYEIICGISKRVPRIVIE